MADMVIEPAGADDYFDEDDTGYNDTMAAGTVDDKKPYIMVIESLPNITKASGDSIRLKCRVDGSQPIDFKWWWNDAPLLKEKGRITVKNQDYMSRLRISDLHVLDSGFYRCEASNRAGRVHTTSLVKVNSGSAKNRQYGGDMQMNGRPRGPIDHQNSGQIAGTCQVYSGQACSRYLAEAKVYVHTADAEELLDIERQLQAAIIVINNSSQVSERCKIYAEKASCYHNYQICDSEPAVGKKSPPFLDICRRDCFILENDLCYDEYKSARDQRLVGQRGALLPDCKHLPEHATKCVKILDLLDEKQETHSCYVGNGISYRGMKFVSETGKHCKKWHDARLENNSQYKSSTHLELTDNNFCRNPGGEKAKPWCFTVDGNEEYCNIDKCPPGLYPHSTTNEKHAKSPHGAENENSPPSGENTGFLGIPLQYIFMAVGIIGVLLVAILIAVIYKCAQSKRNSKKKKALNGNCSNGVRKTQCAPTPEHQIEMMHLMNQRSAVPNEMPPEVPTSNIRFLNILGEGQFGYVWKGELYGYGPEDEPMQVALKTLKEDAMPRQQQDFEMETKLMSSLRHPNVVELIGFCGKSVKGPCMIFEFMMHGDLHEFLLLRSPYSQMDTIDNDRILLDHNDFLNISIQIASGMEYLAANRYVHRDLAARNCLVTDRLVIKISDFGLTRDIYASDYYMVQSQKYLPIRWMPPEAILYGRFSEFSDVWAFGITVWEMYSYGTQPYFGCINTEVLQMVRQRCLLECPENCPPRMYSLMMECWHETASRRPRFAELHARLQTWSVVSSPAQSTVNTTSVPMANGPMRAGSVMSGHSSGHMSNPGATGPNNGSNPIMIQNSALNGVSARNSPYCRTTTTPAGVSPNNAYRTNGASYSLRNAAAAYGYSDGGTDSVVSSVT